MSSAYYLLTYSLEQSPYWEANMFSASQKIPRILWKPRAHYRNHKCPSPVPILSQLDPVHTSTSHFLKIHIKIILPSTPGSPKWSISFRFLYQNPVYASPLPHTRYMLRPQKSLTLLTPQCRNALGAQIAELEKWICLFFGMRRCKVKWDSQQLCSRSWSTRGEFTTLNLVFIKTHLLLRSQLSIK